MANKITIFSKNNCMQCKMTKKLLDKEGADYQEINIDERPEMIDYVKDLASLLRQSLKQVTLFFSGFQPAKLKEII